MDTLILGKLQFAVTASYHFLFVPLTLGLSILVAIMETLYVRTGNEEYKKMTKFWGKLFLINFAMGVVTGLVMEFQFGMNWSEYSRFVGDIFGAPLAIEALLAFFIESTFLGVWIFGWDKLSKKLHALCIWLVAFASNLSAVWILIANSFMQNPVGYTLNNGRAEMVDFFALLTNPHVLHQIPHTLTAGYTTASFFVLGVSAYHLLKKSNVSLFKRSMKIGLIAALISVLAVTGVGHLQGQYVSQAQPLKMAAAEAHWETEDPAGLSLFAIIDPENQTNNFEIKIPRMLSFLTYNSFSGEVKGIKDLQAEAEAQYGPGNYVPPVTSLFWSFRLMVFAGSWMVLMVLVAGFFFLKNRLEQKPFLLKLLLFSIPAPYIANLTGWYLAETGRQPWIVYGLLKTEAGISTVVSAGSILTTLIAFTLIYGVLAVVDVYLLVKYIKKGPEELPEQAPVDAVGKGASLWT